MAELVFVLKMYKLLFALIGWIMIKLPCHAVEFLLHGGFSLLQWEGSMDQPIRGARNPVIYVSQSKRSVGYLLRYG